MALSRPNERKLAISIVAQGARTMVALAGRIDENAGLSALGTVATREVCVDLGGVTFINSIGVREWVRALRGLGQRRAQVTLTHVPAVLVPNMNMVPEMTQGATVESFEAPYACDRCGRETNVVIDVALHVATLRTGNGPPATCPECRSPMQLADVHGFFFLDLPPA